MQKSQESKISETIDITNKPFGPQGDLRCISGRFLIYIDCSTIFHSNCLWNMMVNADFESFETTWQESKISEITMFSNILKPVSCSLIVYPQTFFDLYRQLNSKLVFFDEVWSKSSSIYTKQHLAKIKQFQNRTLRIRFEISLALQ